MNRDPFNFNVDDEVFHATARLTGLLAYYHTTYCLNMQKKSPDVVREALHQYYERMGRATR